MIIKQFWQGIGLITLLLTLSTPLHAEPVTPKAVIQTYANIAYANYSDSLSTAKILQDKIKALIAKPSEQTQQDAKQAWLSARQPYGQTEVFRFGNPNVDQWEGQVNAWPLDEGLIDYVNAEGKQTVKEVMPLGLAQQGTTLYLVCRFKDYDNERILALHRFNSVKASLRTFTYPKDFDLQRYDAQGRFGFGDGQTVKLTLTIKKYAGLHIVESPLSTDQTVEEQDDCYIITATVVDTMILDKWLRGFGEDVVAVNKVSIKQ